MRLCLTCLHHQAHSCQSLSRNASWELRRRGLSLQKEQHPEEQQHSQHPQQNQKNQENQQNQTRTRRTSRTRPEPDQNQNRPADSKKVCSAFSVQLSWWWWRWFWVFPRSPTETRTSTRTRTRTWSWSCVTTGCSNALATPASCRRSGVSVRWRTSWLRCPSQMWTPSGRLRWFPWRQEG